MKTTTGCLFSAIGVVSNISVAAPIARRVVSNGFFYNTGKGLLKLNNSPAFIKEFTCNYKYDSLNHVLEVEGAAWLYAIYGSLTSMENHAEFLIESLTDSTLVASWTNMVSEPQPFFERFFLKRIEDDNKTE